MGKMVRQRSDGASTTVGGKARWLAAALGVVLVSASCGSQVSKDAQRAANPAVGGEPTASTAPAALPPAGAEGVPDSLPSGPVETAPAVGAAPSPAPGSKTTAPPPSQSRSASQASPTAGQRQGKAQGSAQGSASPTPQAGQPTPGQPSPAPGAPIPQAGPGAPVRLGWQGTTSGIIGTQLADIAPAVRAWTADVNARGGLSGRPVQMIFRDDGGDAGRAVAVARELVEKEKVVAIFNPAAATTAQAILPYLDQVKVPMIGADGGNPAEDRSEMAFLPSMGADLAPPRSMISTLLATSEIRKVAVFVCGELETCQNASKVVRDYAPKVGVEVVYAGSLSLAQPDYTADIIAARNSGAQAVLGYLESRQFGRVIESAQRQGWQPQYFAPRSLAVDNFIKEGGKTVEGVWLAAPQVPYCCSPLAQDYVRALQKYVPNGVRGEFGGTAWLSGLMLEKVAAGIRGPVTSATLIEGLYALRGETLGGRVPPITFPRSAARSERNTCTVPVQIKGGAFTAPLGAQTFTCGTVPYTKMTPQ
jgi:branched-chain amino acid transport system substrate-binding protein